ncbi:hypothetical protein F4825DRAFT_412822 [Nemania diffusa]|nr:hypothetical protein F4825DRAFT_412822 [Nemania diffusa]
MSQIGLANNRVTLRSPRTCATALSKLYRNRLNLVSTRLSLENNEPNCSCYAMSSARRLRPALGGYLLVAAFLALLTLADNMVANTLPITLDSASAQIPGFWNLLTANLVISTISDLISQLVLISLIYHYSLGYAMHINSFSILIASIYSLNSLFWRTDGLAWTSVIAPVFKIIGGGSHATTFLTIMLIRENISGSLRAAFIYMTGAVIVLCQTIASEVTPFLARKSPTLPYIFSIACCILASVLAIVYNTTESLVSDQECSNDRSTEPLLSHIAASRDNYLVPLFGFKETYSQIWRDMQPITRKALKSLGFIFFVAAIAKATRPLFINYIQHRVGVTPELASYLWAVRTVMSLAIFAVILPLAVILLNKYTSLVSSTITLYTAKASIVLLAIGALLIGLAQSKPVLVSGLVINTLGVATDLGLLAFAADTVPEAIASCFFMAIASLESAGTLIGIAVLYPLYQLCLYNDTLVGGIPYYFCAGLFTVAGVKAWQIKSL